MKIGNVVVPSICNTDARIEEHRKYVILGVADGLVKVAYNDAETDWYAEEDFIVIQE